jgi:hypothetical protein
MGDDLLKKSKKYQDINTLVTELEDNKLEEMMNEQLSLTLNSNKTLTVDEYIKLCDNFLKNNDIQKKFRDKALQEGGRRREMNLKDIKEICKANQIKLSRVVDGKRVAYKKKELMTKLKRKKLI